MTHYPSNYKTSIQSPTCFPAHMTSNLFQKTAETSNGSFFYAISSIIFQPKHIKAKLLFLFNSVQVQSCPVVCICTVAYLFELRYQ